MTNDANSMPTVNDADDTVNVTRSRSADAQSLSTDDAFDLLSNRRRRYLVHCLRKHDTPMSLADAADEIAIRENDTRLAEIPAEEVKRVYTSLYHSHVPRLVDANVVEYSQERDAVALSENAERLERYVDAIET